MKILSLSSLVALLLSTCIYLMMQTDLDLLAGNELTQCYPQDQIRTNPVNERSSVTDIFNTDSWPARWSCGNWSSIQGWTSILSDIVIFLSYFGIPLGILFFLFRTEFKDFTLKKLLLLFTLFIVSCGLTHLVDAFIFWTPVYNLSIMMKFITAIISGTTFIILVQATPQLLSFKSPDQLQKIIEKQTKELREKNILLEHEIVERKKAEYKAEKALKVNQNLYKEHQHRMKNNLQMISSLLFIRASGQEESVQKDFNDIAERVSSINKVNELLLKTNPTDTINSMGYFSKMLTELSHIYHQKSPEINLQIDANLDLPASQLMICGLILTELYSNSIKHAYHGMKDPKFTLELNKTADQVSFIMRDNGKGFEGKAIKEDSFGISIIKTLVAQLEGKQELSSSEKGTRLQVNFQEKASF